MASLDALYATAGSGRILLETPKRRETVEPLSAFGVALGNVGRAASAFLAEPDERDL